MPFWKPVTASILLALALALGMPAAAQWSGDQRSSFTNDCLEACRKNPRVPDSQRQLCDDYCLCVVSEGQKLFNEAQFEQINKDFAAKRQTPQLKQFQELTPLCNRKAFSR